MVACNVLIHIILLSAGMVLPVRGACNFIQAQQCMSIIPTSAAVTAQSCEKIRQAIQCGDSVMSGCVTGMLQFASMGLSEAKCKHAQNCTGSPYTCGLTSQMLGAASGNCNPSGGWTCLLMMSATSPALVQKLMTNPRALAEAGPQLQKMCSTLKDSLTCASPMLAQCNAAAGIALSYFNQAKCLYKKIGCEQPDQFGCDDDTLMKLTAEIESLSGEFGDDKNTDKGFIESGAHTRCQMSLSLMITTLCLSLSSSALSRSRPLSVSFIL